ncbi:MAG: hypothetical protein QM758_21895 [Armatimonas sp.]
MALSLEQQVLLAHLAWNRRDSVDLGALIPKKLSGLAEALFLSHTDTERFLRIDGPRLATQLKRRTCRQRIVTEGRVRGRIEWAATFHERATGSSGYVCREARPDYDQPENQCLFYVMACMEKSLLRLEQDETTLAFPMGRIQVVRNQVVALRTTLPPPGAVCLPAALTAEQRAALRKARGPEYRALHQLVQRHHALCVQPDPALFFAHLTHRCPTPHELLEYLHGGV